MKKKIISAASVAVCGCVLLTGALVNSNISANKDSASAGIFAYTGTDAKTENLSQASVEKTAVVATAAPSSAYGYDNIGISTAEGNLNVRASGSQDADIVGIMPENGACNVLDASNEWYHIQSGDVDGYVLGSYIMTGDAAVAKANEVAAEMGTITCDTLMLRKEPNTTSGVVAKMPHGEKIEILEKLDGWVKASVDGAEGYCNAEYISIAVEVPHAMTMDQYSQSGSTGGSAIASYATQFVGNPYVWGGTSLTKGADCSGFTLSIYAKYGVSLPHSAAAQANMGTKVKASEAQPGDLFFYSSGKGIDHVGMYIGNGQIVHASSKKTGIKISNAFYRNPVTVRRYL